MDNPPKKSKAFWITLIAVLLLLIGGYFLLKNSSQVFGTKGSSGIGKIFAPLLGTSKPKEVTPVNGGTQNNPTDTGSGSGAVTNGEGNNVENSGAGSGLSGTDGLGTTGGVDGGSFGTTGSLGAADGTGANAGFGAVTPQFNPIPIPTNSTLVPPNPATASPETNTPQPSASVASTSICPEDDPLVFTEAEKAQLADLLRQYYLIASTLKTEDDLDVADNDTLQNEALIQQVAELTNDCTAQKADPQYTGPQVIKNNPYYAEPSNPTTTYLPGQSSNWIATSEYYQSGYGSPSVNPGNPILGIFNGLPTITWPDAYYGPKIMNYADFEKLFNIW